MIKNDSCAILTIMKVRSVSCGCDPQVGGAVCVTLSGERLSALCLRGLRLQQVQTVASGSHHPPAQASVGLSGVTDR